MKRKKAIINKRWGLVIIIVVFSFFLLLVNNFFGFTGNAVNLDEGTYSKTVITLIITLLILGVIILFKTKLVK